MHFHNKQILQGIWNLAFLIRFAIMKNKKNYLVVMCVVYIV